MNAKTLQTDCRNSTCNNRYTRKELPAAAIVLGLLVLVLELGANKRARQGSNNAVTAQLVAAKVSSCTTAQSAHQAAIALTLSAGVSGSIAWGTSGLAVCVLVLALWILVCGVCALLGELVLRLSAGITALLLLLAVVAV
jgi:hypothetical protein